MPKRKPAPPDPALEAWELLFVLLPRIRSSLLAAWNELELAPAQARVLQYLDPGRPVAMAELAAMHCCDASNITGLVDRLEARGFIERTPNPSDRRVKVITLTASGSEMRARMLERLGRPPGFINALSPEDQETLRDILCRATRAGALPAAEEATHVP